MSSVFIFQFFRSTSIKIGFKPNLITHRAVEIIEKVGIITSSPLFRFNDLRAISKAAVPLETAIPYFLLIYLENSFSNFFTKDPSEDIHPCFRHLFIFRVIIIMPDYLNIVIFEFLYIHIGF